MSSLFTFLLVVQALIAAVMIGVILMQKSEGGGLTGGGNAGGLVSARGAANLLTRTTAILAALFILSSLGLAWLAGHSNRPGEIDTTLYLRDHVAIVRVTWDAQTIRIAYVDSKNLDYKVRNGKTYIHPNYLGWVSNIAKDMGTNMQLSAIE